MLRRPFAGRVVAEEAIIICKMAVERSAKNTEMIKTRFMESKNNDSGSVGDGNVEAQ